MILEAGEFTKELVAILVSNVNDENLELFFLPTKSIIPTHLRKQDIQLYQTLEDLFTANTAGLWKSTYFHLKLRGKSYLQKSPF